MQIGDTQFGTNAISILSWSPDGSKIMFEETARGAMTTRISIIFGSSMSASRCSTKHPTWHLTCLLEGSPV